MCWSVWERSGDIFLLVSHQHSTVNSHMCVHCAEEIKRCEGFNRDAFKKIRKKYINPTKKLTYCALPSSSKHINKRSPQAHKQIVKKEVLKRRDSGLLVYFLCPIVCLKLSLIFSPFHSIYRKVAALVECNINIELFFLSTLYGWRLSVGWQVSEQISPLMCVFLSIANYGVKLLE